MLNQNDQVITKLLPFGNENLKVAQKKIHIDVDQVITKFLPFGNENLYN